MSEEQTSTLSLRAAYAFGDEKGLEREIAAIRDMIIEWDMSYSSSLRRGYIVELFESHGILEEFKQKHWSAGNTPTGEGKLRRYRRIKQRYIDFLAGRTPELNENEDAESQEESQAFAAESDLRDYLAENPGRIEPGLKLYQDKTRSGVEFSIDAGFIDILAVDAQKRFVVIELKVGRGRNKTIGQLLYYMGWVDKNLGAGPCRGMIIAKEISDDLEIAVRRVPDVTLHQYTLSVSVQRVSPKV